MEDKRHSCSVQIGENLKKKKRKIGEDCRIILKWVVN
jgi:hypothetical protein